MSLADIDGPGNEPSEVDGSGFNRVEHYFTIGYGPTEKSNAVQQGPGTLPDFPLPSIGMAVKIIMIIVITMAIGTCILSIDPS